MSLPNQIAAYEDCFDAFDRALADEKGVRVQFGDQGSAKFFQMRMQQARSLQRAESARLYERSDVRWNKSIYDSLVVRNPAVDPDGAWWIYIERHGAAITAIESISEIENEETTSK